MRVPVLGVVRRVSQEVVVEEQEVVGQQVEQLEVVEQVVEQGGQG